jgi:hypothetical protein
MRLSFGKDQNCPTGLKSRSDGQERIFVPRRIERFSNSFLVTRPSQWNNADPPKQHGSERVAKKGGLRREKDAPRDGPAHQHGVDERVRVVNDEENGASSRDPFATIDLDRSIEPSKSYAGERAKKRVHDWSLSPR